MAKAAGRGAATGRGGIRRLTLGLTITVAVLGVVTLFVLIFGQVNGVEFCPDTFARRRYHYLQIPLVQVQISPVSRTTIPHPLESTLAGKKYMKISPACSRWDVVHVTTGVPTRQGDAAILCNYLDLTDDNGDFWWLIWTNDHPQLAQVLWPAVRTVAQQQAYPLIPDLLQWAWRADEQTADEFRVQLHTWLGDQFFQWGNHHREAGQQADALRLYEQALIYQPDHAGARRQRDALLEKRPDARPSAA